MARYQITRKVLTPMEEYDIEKLKYVEPKRGEDFYNPLTQRFMKNTRKNRVNVLKKVEDHNQKLITKYIAAELSRTTDIYDIPPPRPVRQDNVNYGRNIRQAMGGYFTTIDINNANHLAGVRYLREISTFKAMKSIIQRQFKKNGPLHLYTACFVIFKKDELNTEAAVGAKSRNILTINDIPDVVTEILDELIYRIDIWEGRGSGFTVEYIDRVELNFARYRPLGGASYIPTPDKLKSKNAIQNPKNENDHKCAMYAILMYLHPANLNSERINQYIPHIKKYNWEGVEFPAKITHLKKFEQNNNISINVYMYDNKEDSIIPVKLNKDIKDKHINLLLLTNMEGNSHYTLIKNFSSLVSSKMNKHEHKTYPCFYCLHLCSSEEVLKKHVVWCKHSTNSSDGRIMMPKADILGNLPTLQFKNYKYKTKAPFVIYADFEAILRPAIGHVENVNTKTRLENIHVPCGFCLYAVSSFENIKFNPILYRGENCMDVFFKKLTGLNIKIRKYIKTKVDLVMTDANIKDFDKAKVCHICEKPFIATEPKARDHCHFTGKYRGAAHMSCNVNLNDKDYKTPVIFHNLKNYDAHFIISAIDRNKTVYDIYDKETGEVKGQGEKKLTVIANNAEKYMSFTYDGLRFIDSYQFLSASLDELVNNLKKSNIDNLKHTKTHMGDHWLLACQKGVYPYEYMNSFDKFDEKTLPPKTAFYSNLYESEIDDKDYKHAKMVWETVKMNNMGEYHDYYLKSDVLLLADVFETFRNKIKASHELDPAHYITLPSYSWDAMLHHTKIELELLTDYEMLCMVEAGRGGISVISHRYAKANNPYLGEDKYDPNLVNSYIIYLDSNNLYGGSMEEYLLYRGFQWLPINKFHSVDDINKKPTLLSNNPNEGYFLMVDLDYPNKLHDIHNDYPLAAEKLVVKKDMYSHWKKMRTILLKKDIDKITDNYNVDDYMADMKENTITKLCPNLLKKTEYVVHSKNLEYYIKKRI